MICNNENKNIERIKRFGLDCKVADRCFHNGVEYVDLGLPSGTMWATMNIGANTVLDGGLYFQWGDTQGFNSIDVTEKSKCLNWDTYKFASNGRHTITKYNIFDTKKVLDIDDDAAAFNLGGSWRIPSKEDFNELYYGTNKKIIYIDGLPCAKFEGKTNSNREIIFPAQGFIYNDIVEQVGERGYYWTSSSGNIASIETALCLYFGNDNLDINADAVRFAGFAIRPILKP